MLLLLAEHDDIIPAGLGRRLYGDYAGSKRLWVHEGATHNTMNYDPGAKWWREAEASAFLLQR